MASKKDLSERDICTKFILPALTRAGWDMQTQIRREVYFTDGRIYVKGNKTTRGKGKKADFILFGLNIDIEGWRPVKDKVDVSVATNLLFFTKGTPTKEIWYYEHKLPSTQKSYSKTKPIKISEFDSLKEWWADREENEQAWRVDIQTIKNNGFNLDIKNPHKEEEEKIYSSTQLLDMLHKSFVKSDELLSRLKMELT